jgi:hypothetical protein
MRWLLFEYKGLELLILSKPFKKKMLAEKALLKYSDRVVRRLESAQCRYKHHGQSHYCSLN